MFVPGGPLHARSPLEVQEVLSQQVVDESFVAPEVSPAVPKADITVAFLIGWEDGMKDIKQVYDGRNVMPADILVPVGEPVEGSITVQNSGTASGILFLNARDTATGEVLRTESFLLDPGQRKQLQWLSPEEGGTGEITTMPNRVLTLKFEAGHVEGPPEPRALSPKLVVDEAFSVSVKAPTNLVLILGALAAIAGIGALLFFSR